MPARAPAPALAVVLVALSTLLAGCAAPSGDGPKPTKVAFLEAPPALAAAGSTMRLAFAAEGGTAGVDHADVHYGPSPTVNLAGANPYPSSVPGTLGRPGLWTADVPVPASGAVYVRAHLRAGGQDLWSPEAKVEVAREGPRFEAVSIPSSVEAGVPFRIRYTLAGNGSSDHVGAHFSATSSAAMPPNFPAGNWTGNRPSNHTGGALPLGVDVDATIPYPGTWYVRPHTILGGVHHWGAQVMVQAGNPATPNIVTLARPSNASAGAPAELVYALNAPAGTSGHVGAHYSMNSSAGMPKGFPPGNWTGMRASPHHGTATPVAIPANFTVNLTFPLPGTWYVRPHAIVGSEQVWGDEFSVRVGAPAKPVYVVSAPSELTVSLTALNVQPVVVEWAVVPPGAANRTNHTHVHHGAQNVSDPQEAPGPGTYLGATPVQEGAVPALFRANFTPPSAAGNYHLRAMAMLETEPGTSQPFWSDEWVVVIRVQP